MKRTNIILTFTTVENSIDVVTFDSFENIITDYIRKKRNGTVVVHVNNTMNREDFGLIILEVSKRIENNNNCRIINSHINYNFDANYLIKMVSYSLEIVYL